MSKIILSIVLAITFGLISSFFLIDPKHYLLIALVVFLVTLWTNEGLPLGVVSLLPILLFPAFNILSLKETANNYANPVIFLFLGGFMIAIAVQKTGLHKFFAHAILPKSVQSARSIIFSLGLVSAILSSLLSNTTTALLLLPVALFLTEERVFKARFVLAIAYGASIGGILTPIGTPPNLIFMGFLESQSIASINFANWMVMTAPLVFVMLAIMPFILAYGLPEKHQPFLIESKQQHMSSEQRKLSFILISLALLLFFNGAIEPWYSGLGLNDKMIMLSCGLLMFLPGFRFLNWEDTRHIPYEIIFLFGAGFSIANAFMLSGLAESIASGLQNYSQLPPVILIIFIAFVITFSTEITSNTALISLALPVIFSLAKFTQIDIRLILLVTTICASYAFMLPIATPPNAIAMSSGSLRISEMMKIGFVFNLIGIILISLIAWFFWRILLSWNPQLTAVF